MSDAVKDPVGLLREIADLIDEDAPLPDNAATVDDFYAMVCKASGRLRALASQLEAEQPLRVEGGDVRSVRSVAIWRQVGVNGDGKWGPTFYPEELVLLCDSHEALREQLREAHAAIRQFMGYFGQVEHMDIRGPLDDEDVARFQAATDTLKQIASASTEKGDAP